MNDNDFEKILDEAEREGIKMSQGLSKMLMAMWKNAADDLKAATAAAKKLKVIAWIAAVIAALCLCCCAYLGTVVKSQGEVIQQQSGEIAAIHRILEQGVTVEETVTTVTEETTTQSVEGDTATINNGTWYNGGDGE